jgi:hypothetical protein
VRVLSGRSRLLPSPRNTSIAAVFERPHEYNDSITLDESPLSICTFEFDLPIVSPGYSVHVSCVARVGDLDGCLEF